MLSRCFRQLSLYGPAQQQQCAHRLLPAVFSRFNGTTSDEDPLRKVLGYRDELAKDGHGIQLYDPKYGRRTSLMAVVTRFKRLDWGMWIRPQIGRSKKKWRKSRNQLIQMEKHVFCLPDHKFRFDRAVTTEWKEVRHIPDDPYKVYNDLSFQKHDSVKSKNKELIYKYGPKAHNFPVFKAMTGHKVRPREEEIQPVFEPPGYSRDIHDGEELYNPDPTRPQDIMAPHYQLIRRGQNKMARIKEDKYWKEINRGQGYVGRISNCSKLRLPVVGTELG